MEFPLDQRCNRQKWKVGELLEAEMGNPNNDYWDTFHPVQVLSFNERTNLYKCRILAFEGADSLDEFKEDRLTKPREREQYREYQVNEPVHFFWMHRRVGKRLVDCKSSNKGIWVKGIVRVKKEDHLMVEHHDWSKGTGILLKKVTPMDLRPANHENSNR
jgi:hypothetical protein